VLSGQRYFIHKGTVTEEYGLMVDLLLEREKRRTLQRHLPHCCFVNHESHMNQVGLKSRLCDKKLGLKRPSYVTDTNGRWMQLARAGV
jgi:hypothetical protein